MCLPWCREIADTVALLPDAATLITIENVVIDAGRMTLNYTVPVLWFAVLVGGSLIQHTFSSTILAI